MMLKLLQKPKKSVHHFLSEKCYNTEAKGGLPLYALCWIHRSTSSGQTL